MEAARDSGTKKSVDIVNKVKIEENVLNHLIDNKEIKRINEFSKSVPDPDRVDDLTFHFIIKKFNQRYNKVLNESQKEILQQYVSCTSAKKFDCYVDKKVKSIENDLYEGMKTADRSMISKLWEAMQKLGRINEYGKDKKTELLMTYSQLCAELKNK
jgi:hypothetical protein